MSVSRPSLAERIACCEATHRDRSLATFLGWVRDLGLHPYPEQDRALRALASGYHVILGTPTGSGKSLVALGLHFLAMCEGRRSFYTSPTKALANEKFFALCADFGAADVGMLTGDAAINRDAPVICCTTEVLSNMCLRHGEDGAPPYVVMDEFHFYADAERGVAWQVPLIVLRGTTFLLMSATLGDMTAMAARLETATGRRVVTVTSDRRPVPLDFEYRDTPLHQTVETLLAQRKAPIYVVSFSHRGCADVAQRLTSANLLRGADRRQIEEAVAEAGFDTPFGRELRRYLRFGIGVHHAGMLPKYRLLVEHLAQRGLLQVISGTDTLGVGVNIPIRTVLFTRLAKYDGARVGILSAREFRQIAGRAGRKGFDDRGSVVCQAPEHVVAAARERQRAGPGRRRRPIRRKPPPGTVVWNRQTFDQLVTRPPEPLVSRFRVTHGMVLAVLQREPTADAPVPYAAIVDLVARSHEEERARHRLLRQAAEVFRSLRQAELVGVRRRGAGVRAIVAVDPELQIDFSLHESLALYLVETVPLLDPAAASYALDVLTLAEAIVEDPVPILRQQQRQARSALLARLKAEGVGFEERIAQLDGVVWPQPRAAFIRRTFDAFARRHPWVRAQDIRPKSIAREMIERQFDFGAYVRQYGIQRSEGLLLRHLGQVVDVLDQTVPDAAKTPALEAIASWLRATIAATDSSLVAAWEALAEAGADDDPEVETVD